ncbi:MAG: aminoglycoside 6-adenylyltransferase [Caldilineaceae bacterium]
MNNPLTNDPIIQQLIRWAERQDSVRAMLLTSTRAIPHATVDLLSDYDVILVVRDIHPFHVDRRWLQAFGQVLVSYWDPIQPDPIYGFAYFGNVIEYGDGLKIDFTLWPVALLQRIVNESMLPAELDAGYQILLDKDQLTDGMPPPSYMAYRPTPPTHEFYQTFVEEFFSDVPYVAKCLWRHELLPAKWCLDYDMKHVYLRQLLEWRMAIDHHWSTPTGALGKGLKKQLPPALWSQLEASYAGADVAENWAALYKTIALFRQVASEVAEQLGYRYPVALDQQVTTYAQKIQRLPPGATCFL